jgi:peptide/nickel transport system permease protein
VVGTLLGLIAGYYGGWADEAIMRLVDIWLAMPFILIALIVAVVIGQSVTTIIGLLALAAWSAFVRNIRAEVLSLKTRDYVALSQISGASTIRILFKHIIPGVSGIILVIASLQVGSLILSEATLSYLGAGIPGPTPAWGLMVSEGQKYISTSWWLSVFPGGAIFLVVMAFNFLGDWLRDRFDPRLSQQQ